MQAATLHTGQVALGMNAHITGFGLTGEIGVTFPAFADGNMRAGINQIDRFGLPGSTSTDNFISSRVIRPSADPRLL